MIGVDIMNNIMLTIGNVIIDENNNKKYRVIAIVKDEITLCEMNINNFSLIVIDKVTLFSLISSGEFYMQNQEHIVIDKEKLSKDIREKFEIKKQMMTEVIKAYEPSFIELNGKKSKEKIKEIIDKCGYSRWTFWRVCTKYFQSGFQDYSLIDAKCFGNTRGKEYMQEIRTGRPSQYLDGGIVINDEIISFFEEALKDYKSGRHKTIRSAFDKMNLMHFTRTEIINGVPSVVLMPASERPTYRQFSYYFGKHLTNQEKDLIKTSALEQKNNKRLLVSDSLNGVNGPGDLVEIDACEADISLVSVIDPSKTIGRPIVYFMVDVYSRIILAVSVAFDNNSMLGLSNLFLNLADDKQKYCERYGISYENKDIWPSNIIPNRVRVDKGAEFRSKEFERICNELGVERNIVLPGCGSLKGIVEQSFRQLHLKQNHHLENHGLIEKRHDSKHHNEAMLNIEEYTKMVIGFVLTHNQQCLTNYPLTKDMITKKIKPIPALLWEYGIKNGNVPRPIPSMEQYLYNLMTPINAKVSRKGISHKELYYLNTEDRKLAREMFDAGNKRKDFEARMDMRDVGAIYYIRDNKLMAARLNPLIQGNAEYAGMTMKEYEDFRKGKKELLAAGKVNNEELSAFNYAMNNAIVEEATKPMLPSAKDMRPAREVEKQAKSKSNKISKRLEQPKLEAPKTEDALVEEFIEGITECPPAEEVPAKKNKLNTYSNWDEALEDW
ncbi:MAG: transposase family protein [Agathobacter sp.]|nr:transposase family protein [Agathobacter sp.]